MKINSYIMASASLFTIVGLVHLLRAIQGWPVELGTLTIPVWLSGVAFVISAALATWGFSFLRKA
jgi:hypothetical protein